MTYDRADKIMFWCIIAAIIILVFSAATLLSAPPAPRLPQSMLLEQKWASPMPYPERAFKYHSAKYTQSIAVVDGRDRIERVPILRLRERKWRFSGGLMEVDKKEWVSEKYRTLPEPVKHRVRDIAVWNGSNFQNNRGIVRDYPNGTRFDDVLSNKDGVVFEHRTRVKKDGKWSSSVIYSDVKARPAGYNGLKVTCASCHDEAGSGGYGEGLVPGGDTVLSDPLDWYPVTGKTGEGE